MIVSGTLLGILQDLVRFLDLLELLLGVRLFADVRMKFARQTAIGLLDLIGSGRTGNAQHLVVITVFHECLFLSFTAPVQSA